MIRGCAGGTARNRSRAPPQDDPTAAGSDIFLPRARPPYDKEADPLVRPARVEGDVIGARAGNCDKRGHGTGVSCSPEAVRRAGRGPWHNAALSSRLIASALLSYSQAGRFASATGLGNAVTGHYPFSRWSVISLHVAADRRVSPKPPHVHGPKDRSDRRHRDE